jgi:hypothetical protein
MVAACRHAGSGQWGSAPVVPAVVIVATTVVIVVAHLPARAEDGEVLQGCAAGLGGEVVSVLAVELVLAAVPAVLVANSVVARGTHGRTVTTYITEGQRAEGQTRKDAAARQSATRTTGYWLLAIGYWLPPRTIRQCATRTETNATTTPPDADGLLAIGRMQRAGSGQGCTARRGGLTIDVKQLLAPLSFRWRASKCVHVLTRPYHTNYDSVVRACQL